MDWSKSRRANGNSADSKETTDEVTSNRSDTKHFITEMESKLGDFDTRLKQRRRDVAIAEAEIVELERLVNAATQAIGAAQPNPKAPSMTVVENKSPAVSAVRK